MLSVNLSRPCTYSLPIIAAAALTIPLVAFEDMQGRKEGREAVRRVAREGWFGCEWEARMSVLWDQFA